VRRFQLYGWRDLPLADACGVLAGATGATFDLHDSDYRGGEYYAGRGRGGEEITVQENAADDEGYLVEPDFPGHRTLAYVTTGDEDPGRHLEAEGLELLRDEVV